MVYALVYIFNLFLTSAKSTQDQVQNATKVNIIAPRIFQKPHGRK